MQDTGQVPEPASEISEAEKRGHAAVEKLLAELDAEEKLVEFVRKQQEEQVSTSNKAQIRRQRFLLPLCPPQSQGVRLLSLQRHRKSRFVRHNQWSRSNRFRQHRYRFGAST